MPTACNARPARRRAGAPPLYASLVPPVVIAENGVDAKRCFELAKNRCPSPGAHRRRIFSEAVPDDVVAEQKDRIGAQSVRLLDDALESFDRHPRLADVQVRKHSQPQLQFRRPARRRQADIA